MFLLFVFASDALERSVADLCGSSTPNISLLTVSPTCRDTNSAVVEGAFIPNIAHTSEQAFDMLRFVGKLMGISIRTKVCRLLFVHQSRALRLHVPNVPPCSLSCRLSSIHSCGSCW